jgi:hypothetical protein
VKPPLPTLEIPRLAHRVVIDGDLHKAPWTGIAPAALVPSHGRALAAEDPEPQPTALRACHDGTRLYLAFSCADREIWGSYTGRNEPLYDEEVVEAFLAPGDDPRRYYELESSPRGAWFEARVESPEGHRGSMRVDRDWVCGGWERGVRVEGRLAGAERDSAWQVEWAIPFAALGAPPPEPGARWRANFYRIDRSRARTAPSEFSAWSPTLADPPDFHVPDRFGVLVFL